MILVKRVRLIKCMLFILILINSSFSFSQVYNFQKINQQNGLPSSSISSLTQDSRNLIWIGTDGAGLVRFDGSNYFTYDQSNGLLSGFVTDVKEDVNSNLVISTKYRGIFVFDGHTFFKHFDPKQGQFSSEIVYKIEPTKNGVICFAQNEIFFISNNYELSVLTKNTLNYGEINSVIQWDASTFYFSTSKGVYKLKGNQISKLSSISQMHSIVRLDNESFIIGNEKGEIWKCLPNESEVKWTSFIKLPQKSIFQIQSMFIARSGNLWIAGNDKQGVYLWNGSTFTHFNQSNGFDGNYPQFFYQDKARNLYIGTYASGLFRTGPQLFFEYKNLPELTNSDFFSIYSDKDNLYVGSMQDNLKKFEIQANGQLRFIKTFSNSLNTKVIYRTKNNLLLVGKNDGLYHEKSGELALLPQFREFSVILIHETNDEFFIGTYGQGLLICDKNLNIKQILSSRNFHSLPDYIYSIHETKTGKFLISSNIGLTEIKRNNEKYFFNRQIISDVIGVGTKDIYGNFWYAGSKGIYSVNNKVQLFTKENGLSSLLVYTLIADLQGNIWSGSNLGLDRIETHKNGKILNVKHYNSKNGFNGLETNMRAQHLDVEGNLFLGTANGLMKCMTAFKMPENIQPDIKLTNVQRLNEEVDWKDINFIEKWYNIPPNGYEFQPNENQLTFHFTSINAGFMDNFYYSYKLEGLDNEWSLPTSVQSVNYSNLKPGNYRFLVRLVDKNNIVLNEVNPFEFSIKTPIYLTWWFIVLCCFIVFVVFYILIKQISSYNKDFVKETQNSKDFKTEQLRIYLFFLGFLAPLSEILFDFFEVRKESELFSNLFVGVLAMLAYLVTKKSNWLRKNLYPIIALFFIAFTIQNWYKILFFELEQIILVEFFFFLFLAHILLLNIRHYWVYVFFLSLILISLFFSSTIRTEEAVIIATMSVFILIVIQIKNIINLNLRQRFILADKIVNNSKSLVITATKDGKITFVSDNVKGVLGFEPSELLGNNWWDKTTDEITLKENSKEELKKSILEDNILLRLVKTKDGKYRWIQWHDKKFSDNLVVGIGQDVTDLRELELEKEERQKQIEIQAKRLEEYAKKLEFENTLKELLMKSNSYEEISRKTLAHIYKELDHVVLMNLMYPDKYENILQGYQMKNGELSVSELYVSELNSYIRCKNGEIVIERELQESKYKSLNDESNLKDGIQSYIVIPIQFYEEFLGVLFIGFDKEFSLTDKKIKLLKEACDIISIASNRIRLQKLLKENTDDLMSSIQYASTIQHALFPDVYNFSEHVRDISLYFKPKDLVSGDFYWTKQIDSYSFIALGDCTGHGVPGAFLTLLGISFLEQIIVVDKVKNPALILEKLDQMLYDSLNRNSNEVFLRDGMEISLCVINHETGILKHAGAGLGLLYFDELGNENHLRGQRLSIGDYRQEEKFNCNQIEAKKEFHFYMSTDGYQDQLGGEKSKRFSKNRLIALLKDIRNENNNEQERILDETLNQFKGNLYQIDDITVIGFKLEFVEKLT
jgi:PAS domain S-box-containing protein